MANNKIKAFVTAAIIMMAMLSPVCISEITKDPIHEAKLSDIQDINGFGEVLSERVVSYLDANPNADIEDLEVIHGIGPYRIKLLRKEFR